MVFNWRSGKYSSLANVFKIVRKKFVSRPLALHTESIELSPVPSEIPNRFTTGINAGSRFNASLKDVEDDNKAII